MPDLGHKWIHAAEGGIGEGGCAGGEENWWWSNQSNAASPAVEGVGAVAGMVCGLEGAEEAAREHHGPTSSILSSFQLQNSVFD